MVFWVQASAVRRATSATYDETIYLRLAADVVRHGDFTELIGHGVAPLPVLLAYAVPAGTVAPGDLDEIDDARFAAQIDQARTLYALSVGVPLILLVYGWMARRRGVLAGLLAGGLVAASPSVVAHAAIATTDACLALASLVTLAALAAYGERPSAARWLLVGGALGVALGAKYSATFLLPVAALALLPRARLAPCTPARGLPLAAPWRHLLLALAGWAGLALVVAWALHLFAVVPLFSPIYAPVDYQRVFGTGPVADTLLEVGRSLLVPAPL